MSDTTTRPTRSYLLRLWAERDGDGWVWRLSVTPTADNQNRFGLSSLEAIVSFLQAEIEQLKEQRQ